jgi:transcriptional regulator with GAF, ATPase, and Fis domain
LTIFWEKKELAMTQTAFDASADTLLDSNDFNQNYRNLKKLIHALRLENGNSVRKEIFGEEERSRTLTKKDMKELFRVLRKIQNHYEECLTPPIPQELEKSIRNRDSSDWLPWELEAIEKVDSWLEELQDKKKSARKMFLAALEKMRIDP